MSPRPPLNFRPAALVPAVSALLALSIIVLVCVGSFGALSGARRAFEVPTPQELAGSLARVGLTSESLAAAGCSEADAANVGGDAKAYLDATRWAAMQTADQDVRDARAEAERLGRLVRAGRATPQEVVDYRAAESNLAAAISARDSLLAALFDAAAADLGVEEVALLETMHANAGRPVDLPYRVATRTDEEWTALRDALANIKTSVKCGEEAESECEQLVADADGETHVAAARTGLEEPNLTTVTTAFTAALGLE